MSLSKKRNVIRVLHVDDDLSTLEISKQILLDIGSFEIDNACNVADAFKKLATGQYDIVVSDYEMPQKDGLQFLSELREKNNEIPFILFTGKGREEVAIKALNLGAGGYFNKQGSPEVVYGELSHGIKSVVAHTKTELALFEAQTLIRSIVDSSSDMIWSVSLDDFVLLDFNKSLKDYFLKHTGVEIKVGMHQEEIFTNKTLPEKWKQYYKRLLEEGPYTTEYKTTSGPLTLELSFNIVKRGEKPFAISVFGKDITERKLMEEKLKESFEVLERVGENIDAGLAVISKDYHVVWANKRLMNLGVTPNKKCYQTFNHSENVCVDCGAKRIFEQNLSLDVHEFKIVNSKGEKTWVELRVTPLKDKNGLVIAALELAVPINERKITEEELKKSKKQHQFIFENNFDGIIVAKRDGTILSANPAICKMLCMTQQEIIEAGRRGIVVNEERNDAALREQDEKGQVVARLAFKRKDGSTFEAEISSKEFVDFDGSASLLVTIRDVSNRLMLEDKLRIVGSFTRHDVRNKLMSASGQVYLSKKLVKDQPEIKKSLDKIDVSLNSIGRILDVSKEYELIGSQKLTLVDVGKAFDEAVSLFADLKGIKAINKVGAFKVLADQMLSTLFYNLIDNTVKYGETTSRIEVCIQRNKEGLESIVYEDNGIGISSKDKSKIFEKGYGKGTGYGLFLIKKTCEMYGWTIMEEGEQCKGAKFVITIKN